MFVPPRDVADLSGQQLGHVIYAIGFTADFRTHIPETVEAHVCLLNALLKSLDFKSWLYLSSTRVYSGVKTDAACEDSILAVRPDVDGLYNLSKLTGEAVCLAHASSTVRVARIANVFGPHQNADTFLGMLIDELARGCDVVIREAPTSSKDYIAQEDVCWLLERIAVEGRQRIYNVASGEPVSHTELAAALTRVAGGQKVTFADRAAVRTFPRIDVTRIINEFVFRPKRLTSHQLEGLVAAARAGVPEPGGKGERT